MNSQPITYQQLLAEQYEDNARDMLAIQNEYDVEQEHGVNEHNAAYKVGYELADPHEFQRFGGTRSDETIVLKNKEFEDRGSNSVRRGKDVKTNIFNIDTRFRPYAVQGILPEDTTLIGNKKLYDKLPIIQSSTASTSHFIFNLDSQYKNIISAKLSSLQLPNKFFNLIDVRNNHYIYTIDSDVYSGIAVYIANATKSAEPGKNGIQYNSRSNKTYVYLYNTIAPLVVNDTFTIIGTNHYSGITFTVLESTSTYVVIDNTGTYTTNETFTSSQFPYIQIALNTTNQQAGFVPVPVYITSVNKNPLNHSIPDTQKPYLGIQDDAVGQTGFYYSNTSIIPALNVSYGSQDHYPDLSFSILDGCCVVTNSSTTATYTLNFTPESIGIDPPYFKTLGAMLGFNNYLYILGPQSTTNLPGCNVGCGQVSECNNNGTIISEDKIDMNADEYIQLAVANWENIYQQDGRDTYYSVFANIPINVPKGTMIYDILYNNSVRKKYDLIQPENIRYLEIQLFDRLGYNLLMPGVDWQMVIEAEEVLNASLYEKMREM